MLKSLELFGFKSFADRTRFEFDPGTTGVVGPNGSGKSNVVDAIKWILGVQSAKSLRGKSMTDVIFNGAKGRAAAGFAEAVLTFDNANGFLPVETPEVQVGRRIYQGGESEYLVNRQPVRLKDVVKLFLGTGAGSTAYCIIEQGRVDQILQSNPAARRKVFEEAAGISRFKADRAEAERKLARVDQNLLRLTDIVDEVEAQLDSLRTQAAKAAKFRELSGELRSVWLGLAADDSRRLGARLAEVESQLADQTATIEATEETHRSVEARLANLDAELQQAEESLRSAERHAAGNRQEIATLESTIRHQGERSADLEAELGRLRKQARLLATRAQEGIAEHERLVAQQERAEHEVAAAEDAWTARRERAEELQAELDHLRARVAQARSALTALEAARSEAARRIGALETQRDAAAAAKTALEEKRAALDERIAAERADCDRRRLRLTEAQETLADLERRGDDLRHLRRETLGRLEAVQQSLAEQREQRSAGEARKSVLQDLEARQEGLGIGVKEILARASTSDYPPWNRIRGSVSDLLEAELDDAALLEVALGPRAQLLVLDELDSLVEYLASGTCRISGRVGFVAYSVDRLRPRSLLVESPPRATDAPLLHDSDSPTGAAPSARRHDLVVPDPGALPDLTSEPGVHRRADRLATSPDDIPRLAEQLLADTWIVDDLPTAYRLAAGCGAGCRFVTLQGELLEADGTLYAGTVRSETAVLSRKSELRRLKNDLLRLDQRIRDDERLRTEETARLAELDETLRQSDAQLQQVVDRLAETRSDLAGHERDLERSRHEEDVLSAELARLVTQQGTYREQIEQTLREGLRLDEEVAARLRETETAEDSLRALDEQVRRARQEESRIQLELATQRERRDGLRTAAARSEEDLHQRRLQHDEAQRRLEQSRDRQRQATLHLLNTRASLAELQLVAEGLEGDVRERQAEKDRVRRLRAELVAEESRVRAVRRDLKERQHQDELAARDLRFQLDTLSGRIEEEFQVALADVVAEGTSAFRDWLAEHRPSGTRRPRAARAESVALDDDDAFAPEDDDAPHAAHDDPAAESVPELRGDGVEEPADPALDEAAATGVDPVSGVRFEDVREEIQARVDRLRRKLKLMGNVNADSLRDLDDLEARFGHLSEQLQDLVHAKQELEEIVRRIGAECRRLFAETFDSIRGYFQALFRDLFGGGEGDIVLEDPSDPLECGIDIVARPPGKQLRSISLLSGGEKTMTAVALLMAIFKNRPSPFCILDEVDAALDEANVERYVNVVKSFAHTTQFILITHRKPSMVACDVLYGVTMEQSGVSKRMSVRFEDVGENGEFHTSTAAGAA